MTVDLVDHLRRGTPACLLGHQRVVARRVEKHAHGAASEPVRLDAAEQAGPFPGPQQHAAGRVRVHGSPRRRSEWALWPTALGRAERLDAEDDFVLLKLRSLDETEASLARPPGRGCLAVRLAERGAYEWLLAALSWIGLDRSTSSGTAWRR